MPAQIRPHPHILSRTLIYLVFDNMCFFDTEALRGDLKAGLLHEDGSGAGGARTYRGGLRRQLHRKREVGEDRGGFVSGSRQAIEVD